MHAFEVRYNDDDRKECVPRAKCECVNESKNSEGVKENECENVDAGAGAGVSTVPYRIAIPYRTVLVCLVHVER
jgi:hypothetical protein